jgi:hypothetical protein
MVRDFPLYVSRERDHEVAFGVRRELHVEDERGVRHVVDVLPNGAVRVARHPPPPRTPTKVDEDTTPWRVEV